MKVAKGDLIVYSKPFAYCLYAAYKGKRCDTCFLSNPALKRCARCKTTYYCSKECQVADWKDHKYECSYFVTTRFNVHAITSGAVSVEAIADNYTVMTVLLGRIVHKLRNGGYNQMETVGNVSRSFNDFFYPQDITKSKELSDQIGVALACLIAFMNEDIDLLLFEDAKKIVEQVYINRKPIVDFISGDEIGVGIYLAMSAFKHSCRPNAFFVFDGPNLILRSAEDHEDFDVSKVFVSYQNHLAVLNSTEDRKKVLLREYCLDCKCPWCKDDFMDKQMKSIRCDNVRCEAPVYIHNDECEKCKTRVNPNKRIEALAVTSQLKTAFSTADKMVKDDPARDALVHCALDVLTEALDSAGRLLHPLNLVYVQGAAMAIRIYPLVIRKNNEQLTVQYPLDRTYAHVAICGFRMLYGDMNPRFATHLMTIGLLLCFYGFNDGGNLYIQESLDIVRTFFGEESQITQRYKEIANSRGFVLIQLQWVQ